MTKRLWPAAVLTISLLLAGCAVTPTPFDRTPGGAGGPSDLVGITWLLDELNGQPTIEGTFPSVTFNNQGGFNGSGGCNVYTGSYTSSGGQIDVADNIISTMMACDDPIMTQEFGLFDALKTASSYAVVDTRLTLSDQNGTALATFNAQSQDLAGTSWQVTAYNNGQEAVVGVLEGTTPTIEFGADGQLSGTAGCNRVIGSYSTTDGTIELGPLATTQMACPEPEGVMDQETRLVAALESAATYHVEGPTLEMRTADDALAVHFTRA